ncbi:hypothetical protein RRG08_030508 [Elysia crispata]|uniref:Uncharacterized protein n=1 Tax=Elysia crispata TaxID=231223 RepID=A0AAE1ALN6_9GAST|nr:hypothetical protein RRG08_030508 [Elysia crispata]
MGLCRVPGWELCCFHPVGHSYSQNTSPGSFLGDRTRDILMPGPKPNHRAFDDTEKTGSPKFLEARARLYGCSLWKGTLLPGAGQSVHHMSTHSSREQSETRLRLCVCLCTIFRFPRAHLRPVGYFSVIHRLISLTVGLRCWNLATGNPCFVIVDHEASVCEILGEILGHNYAKIKLLKSPPISPDGPGPS